MTDTTPNAATDRKAEILRLGQRVVARRGERRRARRHALAMVFLTAGVTVVAYALAPTRIGPAPIADCGGDATLAMVARVSTTPGLAASLATPATPPVQRVAPAPTAVARVQTTPRDMAQRLTDDQALALLKEAGKPAGLIRMGGRVTLVYHERPEPDLGPNGLAPDLEHATLALLRPYRPM